MVKEPLKIAAIIQARMTSSRLPGKVMLPLPYGSGTPALEQMIKRIKRSKLVNQIIIATTTNRSDDVIYRLSRKLHVGCFRGSEENVLSRYYFAATENGSDVVLRLTSDCPFIDPGIIDKTIKMHIRDKNDYSACGPYPVGMSVEIMSYGTLKETYLNAKKEEETEHVTPYIYWSHPEKFKIGELKVPKELNRRDIRVTLDTPEDYALICLVFDELYEANKNFSVSDIVRLFNKKPYLLLVNKRIIQKKIFKTLKEELKEAIVMLDTQDMRRARDYVASTVKGMK
jgi:spore coat polysaccharide biosynthesis protein SpsF